MRTRLVTRDWTFQNWPTGKTLVSCDFHICFEFSLDWRDIIQVRSVTHALENLYTSSREEKDYPDPQIVVCPHVVEM